MYFTIKKGRHRSRWIPKFTFKSVLIGKITFIGDFSYEIKKQTDSNKAIGLSDSWYHKMGSIRLGWRWNTVVKKIDLVGICYNGGKREIKTIARVDANREVPFIISIEKDKYIVKVGSEFVVFDRSSRWNFLRYYLFFYFGGTTKATKDFKLKIDLY